MQTGSDVTRASGKQLTTPAWPVLGSSARRPHWALVGSIAIGLGLAGCGDDSSAAAPLPEVDASRSDSSGESNGSEPNGTTSPSATNPTPPGGHQTADETTGSPSPVSDDTGPVSDTHSNPTTPQPATIETRLQTPGATNPLFQAFRKGSASAAGLTSLKYHISSISVCESLEAQGSGFNNPTGCLELYRGNESALATNLDEDWTHLADEARASDDGFVNLVSPSSRSALTHDTTLEAAHVRSYNYGIITWALPVKLTATLDLGDGDFLYTHDGVTTSELIGVDNFKNYFTRSGTSLLEGPAEEAVVLLGNGGNWFKFQQPFEITEQDISEGRSWVLDLVFNPDGIVKGYEGAPSNANLREEDDNGTPVRAITVPMIDLVPVPHRAAEPIVRESYLAHVEAAGNAFDLRLELYSLETDPNHGVLGVDVKTLVTTATTEPPPEASKISYVEATDDGKLRFGSFNDSTLIEQFVRLTTVGETRGAHISCATHDNRAGAEGGALIVVSSCVDPLLDVAFTLQSRTRLDGSLVNDEGELPDGGVVETSESAAPQSDASAPLATDADAGPHGPDDASVNASAEAAETSNSEASTFEPMDAATSVAMSLDAAL